MNHHLRFVGPAFAAGVILSLSSCSSQKATTPAIDPNHEITYEIIIYDGLTDGIHAKGPAIVTDEAVGIITKSYDQPPSFRGTTGGRLEEPKALSDKKDFVYPSAYDPPTYAKPGQTGVFPVTPAQPRNFVTTKVGTTIVVKGSKTSDGFITLRVKLDRKVLLGFVNHGKPITTDATDRLGRKVEIVVTENRQEQPRFSTCRTDTTITLKEGDCLLLAEPGTNPPEHGKASYLQKRPAGFIALIRPFLR